MQNFHKVIWGEIFTFSWKKIQMKETNTNGFCENLIFQMGSTELQQCQV